ncbi:peptide-methionine (S)-S-oxide reductase [Mucilaginibacter sp. BJC16-A38]|uniref:peptide-methionine (S)-S-oxide reductase n=1 Tax=Mucilaginibacter phenanthrenivorans TaxID=1234842 RepID=UPI002157811A|nr:peptide-methionine (S)-S-oxide reductase [Mucilaginibacter phenanthrenivorans]MCR8556555.1 peptide-methionine (S)-S-oxide reductase [Mucilaginibacter phenanthrenivorans]
MQRIGLGGSCHWCTEAIFRSLKGVTTVEQGWIAADGEDADPSEAVIVNFDPNAISLKTLIAVHLHTHSCTVNHDMRIKYRSAVYTFTEEQATAANLALQNLQADFNEPIITQVLPFQSFKLNEENYLDYYYKDPTKPFCQNIVGPKLKALLARFSKEIHPERRGHLQSL